MGSSSSRPMHRQKPARSHVVPPQPASFPFSLIASLALPHLPPLEAKQHHEPKKETDNKPQITIPAKLLIHLSSTNDSPSLSLKPSRPPSPSFFDRHSSSSISPHPSQPASPSSDPIRGNQHTICSITEPDRTKLSHGQLGEGSGSADARLGREREGGQKGGRGLTQGCMT